MVDYVLGIFKDVDELDECGESSFVLYLFFFCVQ